MYSLRSFYRIMLLTWLVLVLCMGFIVAHNTGGGGSGSLFAFLFPSPQEPAPLPPAAPQESTAPPPAPVQAAPKISSAPVTTPPAATQPVKEISRPQAEWLALQKGKKAGSGTLGSPQVTTLANGDVEVRFACGGALGNFQEFRPANVHALTIDLMGAWGKGIRGEDKFLSRGVLQRVQIADHRQWLRVSGVAVGCC